MFKKLICGLVVFAVLFSFWGCETAKLPVDNNSPSKDLTPIGSTEELTLPAGAVINSAVLWVWVNEARGQTVNVHRITSDWDEMVVTWSNFGGSFDPTVVGSFTADATGWKSVDITNLVLDWVAGSPNYGVLLEQGNTPRTRYWSSEWGVVDQRPKVEICYTTGVTECITIQRGTMGNVFDTFIWEIAPDVNFGADTLLYTGNFGGYEKQALIKFEMPVLPPPPSGCTLTPGYWKTHSEFGPAPYDDTWAQLTNGASTPFFSSGQTYYEVLWTEPAGNAYYILAHAYIAAELNVIRGTSIPADVQAAWDAATDLFNQYTPAEIAVLKGSDAVRKSFVFFAGILDDYNNGITGPGHCGGY